jgi:hypothetical protein
MFQQKLIDLFVRSDIDQDYFCPALISKIENEPVFVGNPEGPETFQDATGGNGSLRTDEKDLLRTARFFWRIEPLIPDAGGTTSCRF